MKTFLPTLAAIAALAMAFPAEAKNFTIGDNGPVAVIAIPDDWSAEEIDDGVEATSPDKAIYVAAEAVEVRDVAEATKEGIKFFTKQGVKIDPSTQKQTETKIGGLNAVSIMWSGTDKDGPAQVSLTFVILNDKNSVLLTYWGAPAAAEKNGPALSGIANSLKPVAR